MTSTDIMNSWPRCRVGLPKAPIGGVALEQGWGGLGAHHVGSTLEWIFGWIKEGDLEDVEGGDVGGAQLQLLLEHDIIVGLQELLVTHHLQQQRLHTTPQNHRQRLAVRRLRIR